MLALFTDANLLADLVAMGIDSRLMWPADDDVDALVLIPADDENLARLERWLRYLPAAS